MAIREILLLGNPLLHEISEEVRQDEIGTIRDAAVDLQDTLLEFRRQHGAGRAIAAPQIGVFKRIVFMRIDRPEALINPVLSDMSEEMIELWDDCMSFPDLLVRVRRHKRCRITFRNLNWKEITYDLEDDLSELLQHECDHLDGVLAVSRAIDGQSFALRSQSPLLANRNTFITRKGK